jgi:hypothetical protein
MPTPFGLGVVVSDVRRRVDQSYRAPTDAPGLQWTEGRTPAEPATSQAPANSLAGCKMDLKAWLSYFLGILTAAYRAFEPRAQAVTVGRGSKAELVKEFVRSNVSDTFSAASRRRLACRSLSPWPGSWLTHF